MSKRQMQEEKAEEERVVSKSKPGTLDLLRTGSDKKRFQFCLNFDGLINDMRATQGQLDNLQIPYKWSKYFDHVVDVPVVHIQPCASFTSRYQVLLPIEFFESFGVSCESSFPEPQLPIRLGSSGGVHRILSQHPVSRARCST